MGWTKQLPWIPRELGTLPETFREHWRVTQHALRDLPRTIREDATIEMAAGMTFFLLFSLFPGFLFLTTLLPYLPVDAPVEDLLRQGLENDPLSAKHHFVLANLLQKQQMIYEAIDEMTAALEGLLAPDFKEAFEGRAEVRDTFSVPGGVTTSSGCSLPTISATTFEDVM